jgi:hypothetical protein
LGLPRIFRYGGLLLAGAAAYSMSTLFSAMKPILLARFVDQAGFSESLAGLAVATPFAGVAAATLVLKPSLTHFTFRQLVFIFGGILVIGEALSAFFFDSKSILLVAQLAGGISVGILMGASSRIIATTKTPDEIFGFVDMTAVLLMSFMIAGIGTVVGMYGLQGGYLMAALIAFIFTLAMARYQEPAKMIISDHNPVAPLKIGVRPIAVVLMGVLFVTSSGLGFAYMFTIALDLGMQYASAGTFIGFLIFVSALACQLGGWCSGRFGPLRPLAGAFVVCALGWYFAINANNQFVFMIALVPAIFSLQFNFPILLAFSGSLDTEGQWAAIATPLLVSGFAWAAISAGAIVQRWNVGALATATAIGMATCLLLLIPSRAPKESTQTEPAA